MRTESNHCILSHAPRCTVTWLHRSVKSYTMAAAAPRPSNIPAAPIFAPPPIDLPAAPELVAGAPVPVPVPDADGVTEAPAELVEGIDEPLALAEEDEEEFELPTRPVPNARVDRASSAHWSPYCTCWRKVSFRQAIH